MQAVNLSQKLAAFTEHWSPKIVGELNGQYVKLVKFAGEYVWHHQTNEDELFLVIDGQIEIHFRDRVVTLRVSAKSRETSPTAKLQYSKACTATGWT